MLAGLTRVSSMLISRDTLGMRNEGISTYGSEYPEAVVVPEEPTALSIIVNPGNLAAMATSTGSQYKGLLDWDDLFWLDDWSTVLQNPSDLEQPLVDSGNAVQTHSRPAPSNA